MSTNTNPIGFINPIDLGGNELINSLLEKLSAAPSNPVAGRPYYNTTDNKAYIFDGTDWMDLFSGENLTIAAGSTAYLDITNGELSIKALSITKPFVDETYTSLTEYITGTGYDGTQLQEGDILRLVNATGGAKVYIRNGGTSGTDSDFILLFDELTVTEVKALFSAGDGLNYLDGVFSIGTGEVTEAMLSTSVQTKLNHGGAAFSLADVGVSGVSYSNGIYTITHNLDTQYVAVVMRDSTNSYRQVPVNNDAPTSNTIRIYFAEQPTNNQYKVTVTPLVM